MRWAAFERVAFDRAARCARIVGGLGTAAAILCAAGCGPEAPAPFSDAGVAYDAPLATGDADVPPLSEGGRYRVAVEAGVPVLPVGELHSWVVRVESVDGEPLRPTRLAFSGGMPQHDHGFITQPRVTRSLGEGRYLVEGVKFHMGGDWKLKVELVGPAGPDVAIFSVSVAEGGGSAPLFDAGELALLRSLSLARLPPPPSSPSNPVADDAAAARLGRALFFDPGLSASGEISCATCHAPERYFTDGRKTSLGLGRSTRNTPTVVAAAFSPFLFWDGRRDSLWSQALVPIESSVEMGAGRVAVVRYVTTDASTASEYTAVFGKPPDFADELRFPANASPYGSDTAREAWASMTAEDREAVTRSFVDVGRAIEAYERRLLPAPAPFDGYVEALLAGEAGRAAAILGDEEVAGLRLFLDTARTQCLRCHNGPLFTNQAFHDVASGRLGGLPDLGRMLGVDSLLRSEFNCLGPYSGAAPESCGELRFLDRRAASAKSGAFKTPSLREVARTAPYFHDGSLATLSDVLDHYREVPESRGSEITPIDLNEQEVSQLVAFLGTLTGGLQAESDGQRSEAKVQASQSDLPAHHPPRAKGH